MDKYEMAEKLQEMLEQAETAMEDNELRDIPGFEGRYAASASGKIWSYKSKKFLADRDEKYGYRRISLRKNGSDRLQTFMVHRLVAMAWVPNPDNLEQVNHKDEDKTNNHYTNLEWCDFDYNINYGTRNERASKARQKPVRCIETGEVFPSIKAAGLWLNQTSGQNVNKCVLGLYKTAGGYHWEYAEVEKPLIKCVETGETFKSLKEAAYAVHGDYSSIGKCLNGLRDSHKGYHWVYVEAAEN